MNDRAPDCPEMPCAHGRIAAIAADEKQPDEVRYYAVRRLAAAVDAHDTSEDDRAWILAFLATTAKDVKIGDDAFLSLRPVIHAIIHNHLVLKYSGQVQEDLTHEAESLIWKGLRTFKRDNFEGWCYTVLKNHAITMLRRQQKIPITHRIAPTEEGQELGTTYEPAVPDFRPELEIVLDGRMPLSQHDLSRIGQWQPRWRVVLMCRSRVWSKVPPKQWAAWVGECKLELPFPQPEFDDGALYLALAKAWGTTKNNVAQIWSRNKGLLQELDYFKELNSSAR